MLRPYLVRHRLRRGRAEGLAFGRTPDSLLAYSTLRAWKAAGLEPLRMHEGRQSFITSALAAGLHVRRVMELAGYETTAMSLERYARIHRADDERAAAALDADPPVPQQRRGAPDRRQDRRAG